MKFFSAVCFGILVSSCAKDIESRQVKPLPPPKYICMGAIPPGDNICRLNEDGTLEFAGDFWTRVSGDEKSTEGKWSLVKSFSKGKVERTLTLTASNVSVSYSCTGEDPTHTTLFTVSSPIHAGTRPGTIFVEKGSQQQVPFIF